MRDEIAEVIAMRDLAIERRGGIEREHERARLELRDDFAGNRFDGDIRHRENDHVRVRQRLGLRGDFHAAFAQSLDAGGADFEVMHRVRAALQIVRDAAAHFSSGADECDGSHIQFWLVEGCWLKVPRPAPRAPMS